MPRDMSEELHGWGHMSAKLQPSHKLVGAQSKSPLPLAFRVGV